MFCSTWSQLVTETDLHPRVLTFSGISAIWNNYKATPLVKRLLNTRQMSAWFLGIFLASLTPIGHTPGLSHTLKGLLSIVDKLSIKSKFCVSMTEQLSEIVQNLAESTDSALPSCVIRRLSPYISVPLYSQEGCGNRNIFVGCQLALIHQVKSWAPLEDRVSIR